MDQHLFKVNLDIVDTTTTDDKTPHFNALLSGNDAEDISLFISSKVSLAMMAGPLEDGNYDSTVKFETLFIKQIQNHLSVLTNSSELNELNTRINGILTEKVFPFISNSNKRAMKDITIILENQQRLQTSLTRKLKGDEYADGSIFAQPFVDLTSENTNASSSDETGNDKVDNQELKVTTQKQQKAEFQAQQVSYFAIQSLTSILLILIKSAEKNDPTLVHQILTLASQLCEQIPMNCLSSLESSPNSGSFLSKSLKPLTGYINELSLTKDPILTKEATKILLSFAIGKGSLKDLLPILCKLIFETTEVYDVRGPLIQLNDGLTVAMDEWKKEKQETTTKENCDPDSAQEQDENNDTAPKEKTTDEITSVPLEYLKSTGTFPTTQMMQLDDKQFTGQFISSIILAHLDFDNEINSTKQLESGSVNGSISFDFHPNTFKQLIFIIEQLMTTKTQDSNPVTNYILTVCLRLFTTHLKYLCAVKSHINRDLLTTNDERKTMFQVLSSKSNDDINLTTFVTEDELKKWFVLFLKLACDKDNQSEYTSVCQAASKAFVYVIDRQTTSFTEKLSIIHKYIVKNKYPILIEQLLIELNKSVTLLSWIEVLCDPDDNKQDKTTALTILYSFIDIYFDSAIGMKEEQKREIERLLLMFQQLLLFRLVPKSSIKTGDPATSEKNTTEGVESSSGATDASASVDATNNADASTIADTTNATDVSTTVDTVTDSSPSTSAVVIKYITHIFNHCVRKPTLVSKLFNPSLAGLCLMTKTDDIFNFTTIQPVFSAVLPLLAEYLLQNKNNDDEKDNNLRLISWILGKMSNVMIAGQPKNSLETKHAEKLKLPLFISGCETVTTENSQYLLDLFKSNLAVYSQFTQTHQKQQLSSDKEFLMSVYNNVDQGAQLISKMKMHVKDKQRLLKSIEQQANDACAAVFAVYIKHYRRVNLAKNELTRTDNKKPHSKLLSIYSYANYVQTLFATTKAQGGDCNELYEQIKIKTLFLLSTVKESNLIPIIEDLPQSTTNTLIVPTGEQKRGFEYKRQVSRWTKAKQIIKLLRNTMQACIRFKKLMLAKKQVIEQKLDNESLLNQTINAYVYGDCYKLTTSITSEQKKLEAEELEKSMCRQYERAMTRLISYRFIETFIQNLLNIKDENRVVTILNVYLPHLRNTNLEWSHLENIPATNDDLKEDIRNTYYSIIKISVDYLLKSTIVQTEIFERNIFSLLNLCYESPDNCHLQHYQIAEMLFTSFVSFVGKSGRTTSLNTKFIAFDWFRLFVLKLCGNIEADEVKGTVNQVLQQQRELIFNKLILNELKELKQLKQTLPSDTTDKTAEVVEECKNNSLKNAAIEWFMKVAVTDNNETSTKSNHLSSTLEIELCTNQLLILLLRCLHLYDHVRSVCATIDYIQELLYIYHNSQHNVTLLLSLKILRKLIPHLSEVTNDKSNTIIQNLLAEILLSIGNSFNSQQTTPDIVTELVYIYRTVMSLTSSWQMMATQFVFDNVKSYLNMKSVETIDKNDENNLVASLCVLGGYIQPFGLSSIVKIYADEGANDEFQLALIINIDAKARELGTADATPFLLQYLQTNEIGSVSADKLRLEIDVSPPNLLLLPNPTDPNVAIHSLLDVLGSFIEIDTSTTQSLILLQLKRRSISVLHQILNSKALVEIVMQKPYASVIARLSISNLASSNRTQPADLRLLNKQHLEQYSLSLDTCERVKKIVENDNRGTEHDKTPASAKSDSSHVIWNDGQINSNQLIADALSMNALKYNGWKPYASKAEIESFKQGRIGNDEISLVPLPNHLTDTNVFEECGNKHKFPGRIVVSGVNCTVSYPTFIVENLQLSQGKWYFCIKLPVSGRAQVGWVTAGYVPHGYSEMGCDDYSWSYDGLYGYLYHSGTFDYSFTDMRWKENDVCGCGIEIDGKNTQIKYWLNGQLVGTAFTHQPDIVLDKSKVDMLPNGPATTYFPCISLSQSTDPPATCEFIFSPEDMINCPLPEGYKPLLVPKLINMENSVVAYPYSAYLVGDDIQNYFPTTRKTTTTTTTSTTFLRDFVNGHHLETTFSLNDHQLILPENSGGFPFSVDNDDLSSFTISFDFTVENRTDDKLSIVLFTSDTLKDCSIRVPLNKTDDKIRTAIVFHPKEKQTKIYFKDECQIINGGFEGQPTTKFNFHILPNTAAGIQNLAVWKYALPEEHIRRLFTYGLCHVAVDYQQMKEYRNQVNTISFTKGQQQFESELLVPFNQPFEANLWEKKKKQADEDEAKYFKSIEESDKSSIQLFGNKTYLVLNKSKDPWFEYTLVLDILIPSFPANNEQLTLVTLNPKFEIYITSEGHLCLTHDDTIDQSDSTLTLNEYFRLFISVRKERVKIYVNGSLHSNVVSSYDQFNIKSNRIDLFKENDLSKNKTAEDTLRIECQSITFSKRPITIADVLEQIKSPNTSLEALVAPPFWLISPSLIAIGYKKAWIKSAMEQNKTTNIQVIDTILREQKEKFEQADLENHRKHVFEVLSSSGPSIDQEKLKGLVDVSKCDTDEQVKTVGEIMLNHWNDLQTSKPLIDTSETKEGGDDSVENKDESSEHKWFRQYACGLCIPDNMAEWMIDKSSMSEATDIGNALTDLTKVEQNLTTTTTKSSQQKKIRKSIQYSHKQISKKQYLESRIACEHGLTTIYARYTVLNMLKVWSSDGSSLFPWEKFGDCTFIVSLLRLMDYHYTYTRTNTDESIDRMGLLTSSVLKVEMEELLKHTATLGQISTEIEQAKAPLLYQLQKDVIGQLMQFSLDPSLLKYNYEDETNIDEQILLRQPNLNFLYKIINLFADLIEDKSTISQEQIDLIIPILFPAMLVNLIFNIFLLVSTHQMKISILQLFSTLIQASKNFNINEQIQHFLCELLVELSTNTKRTTNLQKTLLDLVFLLIMRQKTQRIAANVTEIKNEQQNQELQPYLAKFSESVRNIFIAMDVINALTDKTKQTKLPEAFFAQSAETLGEEYKFSEEEHEQSNKHFDAAADRQLIICMNKNQLISDSFSGFIGSLPTESEPNPTFYKAYPALTSIPADCIKARAKLLYQFNKFIVKVVPMVDLNSLPGQSILTDKIRITKPYLLYDTKFQMLSDSLDKSGSGYFNETLEVHFDTMKASNESNKSENTMFYQAYRQLYAKAQILFRKQADQIWRAQYVGMYSSDAGGPYRDSITRICMDICSTRLSLFILCPNGRTNRGLNRDCWIPNVFPPKQQIPNKLKKQYRFIGQLMGLAIRRKHYLELKFPILLWKQLARDQVTVEDIEAIDSDSFTMINEMEKKMEQTKSNDTDGDTDYLLSSIMSELRFEVVSSAGQIYGLVPGGDDIPITAANLKQYCTMYREYRLNEFHRQIEFIRQGLYSVVPSYYLCLFTAGELEEAVCGKGQIDVELLKKNTTYESSRMENSPHIQRFWTVFSEMFNDEQRKMFLIFVWGRSTLPTRSSDFARPFSINSLDASDGQVDRTLPRSHTCSFAIDLPEYSTTEIMYERLNYAITYCLCIDGDGGMNEAPDPTVMNAGSAADD